MSEPIGHNQRSLHAILFTDIVQGNVNNIKKHLENDYNKVNMVDGNGCTILHTAAIFGSLETMEYLLSLKETKINFKNQLGETPLLCAVKCNKSIKIITSLINHNCDVKTTDNNKNTALHLAALIVREDLSPQILNVGQLLIDKGVDVNAENNRKETALHRSVICNNIEFCNLLIKNGVNIDAKDIDGRTALHEAVGNQSLQVVKLLLNHNASVNITDRFKNTPLHIAVSHKADEIVTILLEQVGSLQDAKDCMKLLVSAISKKMPTVFEIANKIQIENPESLDLSIFKPIYACYFNTDDSLSWVRKLLSKRIPIKLSDIQCMYDCNGFCAEIDVILKSDVFVIYDNCCTEFVQRLVFNCCSNDSVVYRSENRYEKDEFERYFADVKCVPSLMQIARDYCRTIIFNKLGENNFKAHRFIVGLDVPTIIKDVLLLKRSIYRS